MSNREFDTRTKLSLSRQTVKRQTKKHEAKGTLMPQRGPLAQMISGTGNVSSVGAHASILKRGMAGQPSSTGQSLLQLQRQYGNRYVQRVLALARKGTGEAEAAPDVEQAIQRVRGGGQALDSGARTRMESAFGADFSRVRVHTDGEADTLNRQLSARAFTTGQDIFFRQGAYNPGSSSGRELLAHELTHVVQQNGDKVQRKLTVGQPGDKYEQEADQVARAVMQQEQQPVQGESGEVLVRRQIEEEEEEEPVQAKLEDAWIQRQEEVPEEEELVQTKQVGDQISPLIQRQMETSKEEEEEGMLQAKLVPSTHPVAQRELEEEEEEKPIVQPKESSSMPSYLSPSAAGRINSLRGRDEYRPETHEGRHLLAHELTHVLQQNGAEIIRRKILIGGKYYIPKQDYGWVNKHYGKVMVEFLKRMHNKGNAPEYKFKNYAEMHKEIRVRHQAIKGMEEVHKGCCSYPSGSGTGKLDATYWDKFGPFAFKMKSPLPAGKKPSDAVEAIFKSGAGTELECNSTMVAIQYRAMLKMLGRTKFNSKFAGITDLIISPAYFSFVTAAGTQHHPIWHKKLYKKVAISGASDLLPGDWVYFKNIADYITKHPGGAWSGEHALYLGGGKFRGFGVSAKTEAKMKQELLDQYNAGLPAADKKTIGDVPGLLNFARRPVMKEITK